MNKEKHGSQNSLAYADVVSGRTNSLFHMFIKLFIDIVKPAPTV